MVLYKMGGCLSLSSFDERIKKKDFNGKNAGSDLVRRSDGERKRVIRFLGK